MHYPPEMSSNTSRLLKALWINPMLSRIDLAKQLDLNKSTVTKSMAELITSHLVIEVEQGEAGPTGGRKPVHLRVNENYGHILGCEIHQESCRGVGINLNGDVLYEIVIQEKTEQSNITKSLSKLVVHAQQKEKDLGIRLLGISCGIGGIINPFRGVIYESIPLKITQPFNLKKELESDIHLPVLIDNDANCCCWGEIVRHKSKELKDFLFLLAEWRLGINSIDGYQGTAVGLGLALNNTVYYGRDFSAGEFRSVFWKQGNKSQFALANDDIKLIPDKPEIYKRFAAELAHNIAFIVNVLNLKHVFLGGFLKSGSVDLCTLFKEAIIANSAYPELVDCEILFSSMGDNAVAYGAACHFLIKMFIKENSQVVDGNSYEQIPFYTGDSIARRSR
ncbi:MAG: ROK family protein [Spirochaetales bacterium]|nr:ROK family protein [Spirochaetales bacterium]